jgi:hypothetical protein
VYLSAVLSRICQKKELVKKFRRWEVASPFVSLSPQIPRSVIVWDDTGHQFALLYEGRHVILLRGPDGYGNNAMFTPASKLTSDATYRVHVSGADLAGNAFDYT